MYSFIVLGIIPGTDIQIGFTGWLAITALAWPLYKLSRRQLEQYVLAHQPVGLHASQLHQRAV
jgi:hypothetical protein